MVGGAGAGVTVRPTLRQNGDWRDAVARGYTLIRFDEGGTMWVHGTSFVFVP